MTRRIDPNLIPASPNLDFEKALWKAGLETVAGIDEAGRGCLAGPVTAGAVILPQAGTIEVKLKDIRDSKQLSPNQREIARREIEENAWAWGVGWATNLEIDSYGILPATRLAAWRAVEQLPILPDHLLLDYLVLPDLPIPQTRLVKGDARSLSIAAASIMAKTHRDAWMDKMALKHPGYDWEHNKGYGTALHRQALREIGPCSLHRFSFAPLRDNHQESI